MTSQELIGLWGKPACSITCRCAWDVHHRATQRFVIDALMLGIRRSMRHGNVMTFEMKMDQFEGSSNGSTKGSRTWLFKLQCFKRKTEIEMIGGECELGKVL